MLGLLCFVCLIFAAIYFWLIKPLTFWKDLGVVHKRPWPILGNSSLSTKKSYFNQGLDLHNLFPGRRYFGFYQFMTPALVIRDADLIKQIAIRDFDHFTDHRLFVPKGAEPILERNILSLTGQDWRDMRATLSPSFTSRKIKSMFILISDCAEQFTNYFLKKGTEAITVEMKDIVSRFTNDAIASIAFGMEVDSLEDRDNECYLAGKSGTQYSPLRFVSFSLFPRILKFFNVEFFPKSMILFFERIVKETIKHREKEGLIRLDILHLLMKARQGKNQQELHKDHPSAGITAGKRRQLVLSDEDIQSQAMIFFFGGYESLATAISFLSYEIAINPDVQERLRKEIDETLENSNGKITYQELLGMKYLDMVVSESLRKWPSSIPIDRVCVKEYTIPPKMADETPLTIRKGQLILFAIAGIHRDPKYYPNPDKFDPERFSDANKHKIVPYSYMPFGLGPRNCIASRFALVEMKTFIFHLLSKFVLFPVKQTPIPLVLVSKGFTVVPDGGFVLGLQQRSSQSC